MAVPQAKVYLKDATDESTERGPRANTATRYRISARIISFEEGVSPWNEVKTNMFVVKGNPLLTSTTPLPCFASGVGSLVIDLRDGSEAEGLSLQVLINELCAHFGLPLDDILELVDSPSGVERNITLWDTQTGAMRGGCTVCITVDREQPLSVAEIAELRRRGHSVPKSIPLQEEPIIIQTPKAAPKEPEDMLTQLSQRATDLLASARGFAETLEEKKEDKQRAEELSPGRRRRKAANFEINPDAINTSVIPE